MAKELYQPTLPASTVTRLKGPLVVEVVEVVVVVVEVVAAVEVVVVVVADASG